MSVSKGEFTRPSAIERLFNRAVGLVVRLGFAPAEKFNIEVRGRKSGRIFSTPVNLLEVDGRKFLVAARGDTSWVRNARAAGRIELTKGSIRQPFTVRELPVSERNVALKAFLDRFASEVARFFPVPPGSPPEAFAECAPRIPVFELTPVDSRD